MASIKPEVQAIFDEAVAQESGEKRGQYLDEVCASHPKVRARVEALLHAHSEAGGFLGGQSAATHLRSLSEKPGTQIGPYKLLQQIGEGGFGVVYMAEQTKPVHRKVALKIIKPGMDTKEVIARFEAERQALALMDHPNIAKVLDGGTTETGRPYFVMELVKGIPITQFCDENKLDTHQRLRLFISVCRAIQHAHQKGVIHRDIKPSNVLVTLHDGEPVPRVIDFGVAKAISQQLTEKTMFTAFGQMIGTPQYMSPEQAEMSGLDVDTRSDIYSLGVLLYELLTGSTPLDPRKLRETAFNELQRMIREEEPPKPSTRLTTLGDQSALIASNRGTSADRLGALVRGDLDWIVMQTLEKNRERRYDSVNALVADIGRFIQQEPVEACPPSLGYRLKKYVQRNRQALVVLGSINALLIVGIVVSSVLALTMLHERNRANQLKFQAETESQHAIASEQAAFAAATRAKEKEEAVLSVIKFLGTELFRPDGQNRQLPAIEVLKQISDPETRFPKDPETEATLRHHLGVICHRAGLNDLAAMHLERALELRTRELGDHDVETARTQYALAYALMDFRVRFRPSDEQQVFRKRAFRLVPQTVKILEEQLGPRHVETLHALAMQIFMLDYMGDKEQAAKLYQVLKDRIPSELNVESSSVYDPLNLVDSLFVLIHRDEIGRNPHVDAEIHERYLAARRAFPARDLRRIFWKGWYAGSLYLQGKVDEAMPLAEDAYQLSKKVMGEDNYLTFLSGRELAGMKVRQGDIDRGIELLETRLVHEPEHAAQTLNLGVLYLQRNQLGDRQRWLKKANDMLERFEATDNVVALNFVLNLCLLTPPASEPEQVMQERAIALAEKLEALKIKDIHNDGWDTPQHRQMVLALAEYRKGDFEKCRTFLSQLEQSDIQIYRAISLAMRAAIASREGDQGLAEILIRKAQTASKVAPKSEIYTHLFIRWTRPYIVNFLIDEAQQASHLLQAKPVIIPEGQRSERE